MPNNPLFEVHVWLTAKVTDENGLGCFDEMYGYDNKEEALAKFNEIKTGRFRVRFDNSLKQLKHRLLSDVFRSHCEFFFINQTSSDEKTTLTFILSLFG